MRMRKTLTSCMVALAVVSMCAVSITRTTTLTYADDTQLQAVQQKEDSGEVLSGLSTPTPTLTETMPMTVPVSFKYGTLIIPLKDIAYAVKADKPVETVTTPEPQKVEPVKVAPAPPPAPTRRYTEQPYTKTNLSVAQFNQILRGTGLAGYGESYYELEQEYGINGLYAMSVAFLESGYGRHLANHNNFYGMRGSKGWLSFDSPADNIAYFGKLMTKNLYTSKGTISGIGSVYCPENGDWASQVRGIMRNSYAKVS